MTIECIKNGCDLPKSTPIANTNHLVVALVNNQRMWKYLKPKL